MAAPFADLRARRLPLHAAPAAPRPDRAARSGARRPGTRDIRRADSRRESSGRRMPLSATAVTSRGSLRRDRVEHAEVDAQRPEVAAVDADEPRARIQRALQSRRRRALRPAPRARDPRPPTSSRRRSPLLQRADDQQHRVGAEDRRFQQLVLRDDEVLAEERDVDRRPHVARGARATPSKNVGSVSTEIAAAPRPRTRARARPDRSRCAQDAPRRRPPLALGDDCAASRSHRAAPRSARSNAVPRGVRVCSRVEHRRAASRASRTCDDPPRGGDDGREQVRAGPSSS